MSRLARLAALAAAASLLPAASALAANTAPYTNADSQHRTAVEPDTFAFGSKLVVAAQIGRFFDGGASGTGFATSTDNGATFTQGHLPGLTNQAPFATGTFDRATDPVVAYDAANGVWMISSLGLTEAGGLLGAAVVVNRSTDGLNWDAPVTV